MLQSIQYLRAFAALIVAARHSEWVPRMWGDQGVDIFFIISGFIMMHVMRREAEPLTFLRARIERVVPLYWLVTLYGAWRLGSAVDWHHVFLSLAFVPHVDPDGLFFPLVRQGWSLLPEMFFYILFATSLLLPKRHVLTALTTVLGLLAIIGLWTGLYQTSPAASVYLSPQHLEFLAGCWLHKAWEQKTEWFRPAYGVAAITACFAIFAAIIHHVPGPERVFIWGIPSLLLVGGMLALEKVLPRLSPLMLLGNASYSIYLTHSFSLRFFMEMFRPAPGWTGIANLVVSLAALLGVLAGVALVGVLVHFALERPIAQGLKRIKRRPAPAPA
jgi:exopolysaccharide production protein ExoZ